MQYGTLCGRYPPAAVFGRKPFKDVTVGEYDIPKGVSRPGFGGQWGGEGALLTPWWVFHRHSCW